MLDKTLNIFKNECNNDKRLPNIRAAIQHTMKTCFPVCLHNFIQVRSFRLHAMTFCRLKGGQKAGGDRTSPIYIYIYIYIYIHTYNIYIYIYIYTYISDIITNEKN